MRLREYVRKNKEAIDRVIRSQVKNPEFKIDNAEREEWVRQDEGLYLGARRHVKGL